MGSPFASALIGADPALLSSIGVFDEIVHGPDGGRVPDFLEWSAHVDGRLHAARLTYYFDVAAHGADVVRLAGERFLALALALDVRVPPGLARLVSSTQPARPEVLQVVLGIDERGTPESRRLKYYLVFRDVPSALVETLLEAAEVPVPGAPIDLAQTYIVGLDLARGGLDDAKLYFRLDLARFGRVASNAAAFAPLARQSRDLVLQHCLRRPDRRQLYFHASNDRAIDAWLADAARGRPDVASLRARAASVARGLAPRRIAPWILSVAYRDRRLDPAAMNVYFHASDG